MVSLEIELVCLIIDFVTLVVVGLVYAPRRLFSFFYFILNNTFGGIIEEWFTFECQHSWDMMYYNL
jgi:hypothetical protein